jgi:hypothetical protein
MTDIPTLIWNKGLAARCDRRIPDEFPGGQTYVPMPIFAGDNVDAGPLDLIEHPERLHDIGGRELVWVRGSWLPSFVEQVLPKIRGDFVLVTGDTDSSLPSDAPASAAALLDSTHLVHWYTQNYDGTGPSTRMSPIPIGVDLHTISQRSAWGAPVASPSNQEVQLEEIARSSPPIAERIPAIYVDFGWSTDPTPAPIGARLHQPRAWIVDFLRAHPLVVCEESALPRAELWRRRGHYAFAVSPHGNGLDCHRTWEALALGQATLVPSSSLDPLFDDVRAFPLASWQDLTTVNLSRWLDQARKIVHPAPPLTTDHWIRRMRLATA